MNLAQILFDRHGKIGGRDYWIGCADLLFVGVGIHLLAFGFIYAINPYMVGVAEGVFEKMGMGSFGVIIPSLLLISLLFYPYLCLYTKRLRDIGISAYWYIAVLLVYCVGFYILGNAIYGLLALLHIELSDIFLTYPLPGASDEEIVVAIITGLRKVLIATAVINAVVHALITIAIDVALGMMNARSRQKPVEGNMVVFA